MPRLRSRSSDGDDGARPDEITSDKRLASRSIASANVGPPLTMQKFFFDMRDGVPNRDRVGIEFNTNAEAITHCKEMAQDFRDNSLRDDQDLEIMVVNEIGREIYRQFVHHKPE
jgi:hypothetical protein